MRKIVYLIASLPLLLFGEQDSLVAEGDEISEMTARFEYAEVLSQMPATVQEALNQFDMLIQRDPENALFKLKNSQLLFRCDEIEAALTLLETAISLPLNEKAKLELAKVYADFGYPVKSNEVYLEIVDQEEENRRAFASSMRSWGDYYRSLEIERSINNKEGYIECLIGLSRFDEAEAECLYEIDENNANRETFFKQLLDIQKRKNNFLRALDLISSWERENPVPDWMAFDKAYALFKEKCFDEALDALAALFESALYWQKARILEGRILLAIGESEKASHSFLFASKSPLGKIQVALYFEESQCALPSVDELFKKYRTAEALYKCVDYFSERGNLAICIALIDRAVEIDPCHFPSQMRRAELYSLAFDYGTSFRIYERELRNIPGAARLLFSIARTYSWDKKYADSMQVYDLLLEKEPLDFLALLEKARVASWAKKYDLSMALFTQLLQEMRDYPRSLCHAMETICLEKEAIAWRWRYAQIEALKITRRLACLNPGSDFYLFEYGQSLCTVGLCEEAAVAYEEILDRSPLSTLTAFALKREVNEEKVEAIVAYNYWQEFGYGELSQVGRYEVDLTVTAPISCSQKVTYIQKRWLEHTFYDAHYHLADGQSFIWENRFSPYTKAVASLTRKHYLHDFGTTYTGFAQVDFTLPFSIDCQVGVRRTDEIYNYFNLVQTTQANIFWGRAHAHFNHKTEGTFEGQHIGYNDSNDQLHFIGELAHSFTEHPHIFKMSLTGEYRNTAHTNIFIYNPAGQLVDIVFPYWAPQNYFLGQLQFEFRHDYGFFQFCNAPEKYYHLKVAFGEDTQDNPYWQVKGEWHHEFSEGWKVSVAGYLHGSPQWRAKGLWCSIGKRF